MEIREHVKNGRSLPYKAYRELYEFICNLSSYSFTTLLFNPFNPNYEDKEIPPDEDVSFSHLSTHLCPWRKMEDGSIRFTIFKKTGDYEADDSYIFDGIGEFIMYPNHYEVINTADDPTIGTFDKDWAKCALVGIWKICQNLMRSKWDMKKHRCGAFAFDCSPMTLTLCGIYPDKLVWLYENGMFPDYTITGDEEKLRKYLSLSEDDHVIPFYFFKNVKFFEDQHGLDIGEEYDDLYTFSLCMPLHSNGSTKVSDDTWESFNQQVQNLDITIYLVKWKDGTYSLRFPNRDYYLGLYFITTLGTVIKQASFE